MIFIFIFIFDFTAGTAMITMKVDIGCSGAALINQDDSFVQPETETYITTLMVPNEGLDTIYSKITNA